MKGIKSMRMYAIIDDENKAEVGTLLYFDKKKEFIIELKENLDEWNAPLLFTGYVKQNIFTISRKISRVWVQERIIPSGRQNIGSILKRHKLKQYDEMDFLELSKGKCAQDSMYIEKISGLPSYALERREKCIVEAVPLSDGRLLCFFRNKKSKKVDLNMLTAYRGIDQVLTNRTLFESVMIGCGGYYITFNDSIDIPAYAVYDVGKDMDAELEDFITFAQRNIVDTKECCSMLECTRQNLAYMVKQKYLEPIKEDTKGNLYLKGAVYSTYENH